VLAIHERALGGDHPMVARALAGLADDLVELGRLDEALELMKRAMNIAENAFGEGNAELGEYLYSLCAVYGRRAEFALALPLCRRSLEVTEKALGTEHPRLVSPLLTLARTYVGLAQPAEAIPIAERALHLAEKLGARNIIATARADLAIALWNAERDRSRALDLARQARAAFADLGDDKEAAVVAAWLVRREGGVRD
jgi:tetratricopeptide (TPR) repeat protein